MCEMILRRRCLVPAQDRMCGTEESSEREGTERARSREHKARGSV